MIRVFETADIVDALHYLRKSQGRYETLVIPVAADYRLVGLASRAAREFPIERTLMTQGLRCCPEVMCAGGALLLVAKNRTDDPYQNWQLRKAIHLLKLVCEEEEIKTLAFQPFGDETVQWYEIQKMLEEEFGPSYNINIYRRR